MDEEQVKQAVKDEPEVSQHQVKQMSCGAGEHLFLSSRENEGPAAQCGKCSIGFILSPGMIVQKGHIYYQGEQVM